MIHKMMAMPLLILIGAFFMAEDTPQTPCSTSTVAVLQELGIDYCCGGESLEYACENKGMSHRPS